MRPASVFDRHAVVIHAASCVALFGLFIAAARLMTLEADEANILLAAYHAFGVPVAHGTAAAFPTVTNGGLYPLVHGLLGLVTTSVDAHRAVSLVLAATFVAATYGLLRAMHVSRPIAAGGSALAAATPGLLLVAAAAMAEVLALAALLVGMLVWVRLGRRNLAGAILAGVLFGLAGATRLNSIFIFPALLLYALDFETGWRRRIVFPFASMAAGGITLLAAIDFYLRAGGASAFAGDFGMSTGAGKGKSLLEVTRDLTIANDWLPWWGLAGIIGLYAAARPHLRRRHRQFAALLLLSGAVGWAMWVARAPIPHVRYLWPALPCLWLAGIMSVTALLEKSGNVTARRWFHIAALSACLYQAVGTLFVIAQGDSLLSQYQLNRQAPVYTTQPHWSAAAEQRRLAAVVRSLPETAKLYTNTRNAAFPITYLSGRTIAGTEEARFDANPAYLIALPVDYALWRPMPDDVAWRRRYTTEVWRSERYAIFRIAPNAPAPPAQSRFNGANDIYPRETAR